MKVTMCFLGHLLLVKVVLLQTTFVLQPSLASQVFVNLYLDIALKEQFDILWNMLMWYHSHVYMYNMKLQLGDCELNLAQYKDWKEWETASGDQTKSLCQVKK